jgi:DNA repair exonuclease SbcCD ATPase subunit
MIRRLELRRWRAFDAIALDFGPGTTFVVAPNGVGKTSLLLGLTWALFGDSSKVNAKECVRFGHDNAEATVTIDIGNDRQLVIHRTVTVAGKTTIAYSDGESDVDTDLAHQIITNEFGAPLDVAARLAVIRGSGKDDGELDLREHLYDAFGISDLRDAAAAATQLQKEAVAARKSLRSESRAMLANRDQLTQLATKLADDLEELAANRTPLVSRVRAAQQDQRTVLEWKSHDTKVAERARRIDELLARESDNGLSAASLDDLAAQVTTRTDVAQAASSGARDLLTEAQAQRLAAQSALALLEGHNPECPTCARPFHGDELERSIATQRNSLVAAEHRIEAARQQLSEAETELDRLSQLPAAINELASPIPAPDAPRPRDDPDEVLAAAEQELRTHDERAGSISRERDVIAEQISNDDAMRSALAGERAAWRREAITQATAATLAATAERIATEHIEPLSQQVRWRWKALFGEDGLQLRTDGSIVRVVGDRELPWHQLSSGEQLWARLVASLLILQSSTTLPFAWLDEPLEHLDPRARRIVATDLATSTRSGRPAQLIVRTYEHDIARQLSEDIESASILHINRTDSPTAAPA